MTRFPSGAKIAMHATKIAIGQSDIDRERERASVGLDGRATWSVMKDVHEKEMPSATVSSKGGNMLR